MKQILLSLLLVASAACSKNNDGPAPQQENPFSLNVEYENRAYNPGETIDVTLIVEEKSASDDYFLFSPVYYGTGTLVLEGEQIKSRSKQQLNYEIINKSSSSKTLHLTVAPEFSDKSKNSYCLRLYVSCHDGTYVTYKEIQINTQNAAPITGQIISSGEAQMKLNETYEFGWAAGKENYTGEFIVRVEIAEGDGYFIDPEDNNKKIYDRGFLYMPNNSTKKLEYQPLNTGKHQFNLSITDGYYTTTLSKNIEVRESDAGITSPLSGVYIYCNSLYYRSSTWQEQWSEQAEGVAIISDKCRFLLAPKSVVGNWSGGKFTDVPNLSIIPDLQAAKLDFDGRKNTEALLNSIELGVMGRVEFAKFCYNYDKDNPGKWYQPAAGQLDLILQNFDEVQLCLGLIHGSKLKKDEYYLASTAINDQYLWSIKGKEFYRMYFFLTEKNRRSYPVRDL